MKIVHSYHWTLKKRYRSDIADDSIEYAILHSPQLRDKHWKNAYNAMSRIPPSGRFLKVVYRREGERFIIITAFWVD